MKVLVTGPKEWTDATTVKSRLRLLPRKDVMIIEGGERGADLMARSYASKQKRWTTKTIAADWQLYGVGASLIRNRLMYDARPDLVLVFCDDLPRDYAASDCVKRARTLRIPFETIISTRERMRRAAEAAAIARRQIIMATKNTKKASKKSASNDTPNRAWNQTYTFNKALKVEPLDDTIMGCVYRAIKKLKTGDATVITEQALKNGLGDVTGQDARVQTLVMLNRLAAEKVVTKTRGESKVASSPKKAASAGSTKKAARKAGRKAAKKALKVKLTKSTSGEDAVL